MTETNNRTLFKSLFEFTSSWCKLLNGGQLPIKKSWELPHGNIEALLWNNADIPKTGLSFLERDETYRVGLNIYIQNPMIPDGSFAILLAQENDLSFIGGVLELFPTVRIEDDIDGFKKGLNKIAQSHMMDSDHLREGLLGAFVLGGEEANLGAEAGFNFYRAGLDATAENLIFVHEAFLRSLEEYKTIIEKRKDTVTPTPFEAKNAPGKNTSSL